MAGPITIPFRRRRPDFVAMDLSRHRARPGTLSLKGAKLRRGAGPRHWRICPDYHPAPIVRTCCGVIAVFMPRLLGAARYP